MRMSLGSVATAGILASISVVLFLFLVPTILGMNPIDITGDIGKAFSSQSPRVVGTIILAVLGVVYSAIFSRIYNILPGQFITKGIVYGFLVGLFSIYVLPLAITTVNGILGLSGQYVTESAVIDTNFIMTVLAYMVFGLTLVSIRKPAEGEA